MQGLWWKNANSQLMFILYYYLVRVKCLLLLRVLKLISDVIPSVNQSEKDSL